MWRSCVPPQFYRHLLQTITHTHTYTQKLLQIHTHSFTSPPPIPRLRRFEPPAWQAGLWLAPGNGCMSGWMLAGAGLLPLLQSRVSMVYYVLLLLRCFSCSHTVLPKEHSLGVIFFSSLHSSCYAVFFFNSLSSCPVYPIVIYVCCVWTGWWLISLVLVTSDNKGLLLLLLQILDWNNPVFLWLSGRALR